jgi:predicted amidohydrolase
VVKIFFREVVRLNGLPQNIDNDRDIWFIDRFWRELFRLLGIDLILNTSYHPQSDGQTKIVNKWVEGYLRNYVS